MKYGFVFYALAWLLASVAFTLLWHGDKSNGGGVFALACVFEVLAILFHFNLED